jgi:hypothetical protein
MIIMVLLGKNDEYLGYKKFEFKHQAELYIDKLQPIMLANIEGELSLKERIQLAPDYFPFIGRLEDVDLIEVNQKQGDTDGSR